MNIIIIVQARMGSTRLPGKSLLPIQGQPMIHYVLKRLQQVSNPQKVILATTTKPEDDPLALYAESQGFIVFRGSELDVLDRYYQAAKKYKADIVVRITGDCPLIDPDLVNAIIQKFLDQSPKYDYLSNTNERTYPRGLDVEVFSFKSLEEAEKEAKKTNEREHVTPFIYQHPERYNLGTYICKPSLSHHRWTVDTEEDFELIKTIIEQVPENFTTKNILKLFEKKPELYKINAHINQKST